MSLRLPLALRSSQGLAVLAAFNLKLNSSRTVLLCECLGDSADELQRKLGVVWEGEVSLRTSKGLSLFDEFNIHCDWRIDADMLLERSEVEKSSLFLEGGEVVANGLCSSGNLP